MNLSTFMKLARVSNLPTVISQILTITIITASSFHFLPLLGVILAVSLLYTGGMFLNDGFDADWDEIRQPYRPIPEGEASRNGVIFAGILMLLGAPVLILLGGTAPEGDRAALLFSLLLLAGMITWYDWHHKSNPAAPLIMGACRGLVYIVAAYAFVPSLGMIHWMSAVAVASYTAFLTFLARGDLVQGRVVAWLIAGFCVVDMLLLLATGHGHWIWLPALLLVLTRFGHGFVRGT